MKCLPVTESFVFLKVTVLNAPGPVGGGAIRWWRCPISTCFILWRNWTKKANQRFHYVVHISHFAMTNTYWLSAMTLIVGCPNGLLMGLFGVFELKSGTLPQNTIMILFESLSSHLHWIWTNCWQRADFLQHLMSHINTLKNHNHDCAIINTRSVY